MAIQVLVLGSIEVLRHGRPVAVSPLERALAALMALAPARTVSTAVIVDGQASGLADALVAHHRDALVGLDRSTAPTT